jgi:hypothetical protein
MKNLLRYELLKKLKKKQIVSEDTGKVMVEKNEIEYT